MHKVYFFGEPITSYKRAIETALDRHLACFDSLPTRILVNPKGGERAKAALESIPRLSFAKLDFSAGVSCREIWLSIYPEGYLVYRVEGSNLRLFPERAVAACLAIHGATVEAIVNPIHRPELTNSGLTGLSFDANCPRDEIWLREIQ